MGPARSPRLAPWWRGTLIDVERRAAPDPKRIQRHVFSETRADGSLDLQQQGGLRCAGFEPAAGSERAEPQGPRINLVTAVRRTLEHELAVNPRMLVFGEDVGRKGGVHAATLGLQERFGVDRVFDTSLSEEGIIGRAVGMAAAGLMPVPEIQFRKYADPAAEQLNDCGTMRWRTMNRFAAPMVVRIPGGFFKCGDPWHSQSNEVQWLHGLGWRLAMPSNAQDAVGLLRSALRGNDPTIFFEHRSLLDGGWARRPYPGDEFVVPFGKASLLREGTELTVVTWGAMVERCEQAIEASGRSADLLDLRTLSPWDRAATLASVRKTRRCLIVHEDTMTAGFGAEIAAVLAKESVLRSRCADRAPGHAGCSESAQSLYCSTPCCPASRRSRARSSTSPKSEMNGIQDVLAPPNEEGTRATILKWCKAVGDSVVKDEPLLELETDKVTVEIAAPASGTLIEVLKPESAEVSPDEVLARLKLPGEAAQPAQSKAPAAAAAKLATCGT